MNSDRCHNEAQFQWLRYQLDSRVKLLPTLVAKWSERWQTCSASLRTAFMLAKSSKAIMGELQYAQTSGATSIFICKYLYW